MKMKVKVPVVVRRFGKDQATTIEGRQRLWTCIKCYNALNDVGSYREVDQMTEFYRQPIRNTL